MSKGFFSEVKNDKNDLNNYEVVCVLNSKNKYMGAMPKKQKELYILVEQTSNIIKNLPEFRDDERREVRALRRYYRMKKRRDNLNIKISKLPSNKNKNAQENVSSIITESEASDNKGKVKNIIKTVLRNKISIDKEVNICVENDNEKDENKDKKDSSKDEKSGIKGTNKTKVRYTNELIGNAAVGLTGNNAQPDLAIAAIKTLREEIVVSQGGKIKNKYFCRLGVSAFIMALLAGSIGLLLRFINERVFLTGTIFEDIFANIVLYPYFIVFAGAVMGAWIGFGAETKSLSFKQLAVLHKDGLKSIPRLALFGVTGAIFLLFVKSGTVELKLGSITNEVLLQSVGYQVLFGAIAGLLGNRLTSGLVEKAKDLFNATDEEEICNEETYSEFFAESSDEEYTPDVSFSNKENEVTAEFSEAAFAYKEGKSDNAAVLDEKNFIVVADKGDPAFTVKYKGDTAVLTIEYKGLKKDEKACTSVVLKSDSAYTSKGEAFPQTVYVFTYTAKEQEKKEEQENKEETKPKE